MFTKLNSLLDRTFSGKRGRSPVKATSGSKAKTRSRARTVSEPPAPATAPRAASAPNDDVPVFDIRAPPPVSAAVMADMARALSPTSRRVRFSSETTCTTHSKEAYDRSPIVTVHDARLEGSPCKSKSKNKATRERARATVRTEAFPVSMSTPNLHGASASPGGRERRPSLRLQSASRAFVALSIQEEGESEEERRSRPSLTRSVFERAQMRPRPRARPSTDSSRAICGGVIGRGVDGPFELPPVYAAEHGAYSHIYEGGRWVTTPAPPGDSFMNLDYSDDESIDEDLHTGSMFVHGRRASERSATSAHPDALFFTLQPESPEREEAPPSPWEAYGLAETEGKRERERERRERRALLDAFPEPPCEPPSPESHVHLGMLKHHAIAQWVKEASASVTTVGSSEGRDRSESPSPLGWGHGTSTTLGGTPPRTRRAEGPRMRYDAYAVPATSSRTLVDSEDTRRGRSQSPKKGSKMGNRDKLLPLVPFDEVDKPFRFERHPYSAAALGAES